MIPAFCKIFALGTSYIDRIFTSPVEITEKLDGSMIAFASINGELHMRSKGAILYSHSPQKMFSAGMTQIEERFNAGELKDGVVYFGEYMRAPKHNVLVYNRVPRNHIALYGACIKDTLEFFPYDKLMMEAGRLDLDIVPLIFMGVTNGTEVAPMLDRESWLGGPKIEGIVVKNYAERFLLGGQPMPLMAGKFVSEAFKEVHRKEWKGVNTTSGKQERFFDSFRTEARWHKAVQHLAEKGELEYSPRDIGKLIAEVKDDIVQEEKQNIMEFLWREHGADLLRVAVRGVPEFWKKELLSGAGKDA